MTSASVAALADSIPPSTTPKRPPPPPRTAFPEAYLPLLYGKIDTLATSSLAFIVETLHQELKEHKIKKNSIEAKIREVAEKCKEKKVWVIKPDIKSSLCATSPQGDAVAFTTEVL